MCMDVCTDMCERCIHTYTRAPHKHPIRWPPNLTPPNPCAQPQEWLGDIPNLGLLAENGFWCRIPSELYVRAHVRNGLRLVCPKRMYTT